MFIKNYSGLKNRTGWTWRELNPRLESFSKTIYQYRLFESFALTKSKRFQKLKLRTNKIFSFLVRKFSTISENAETAYPNE